MCGPRPLRPGRGWPERGDGGRRWLPTLIERPLDVARSAGLMQDKAETGAGCPCGGVTVVRCRFPLSGILACGLLFSACADDGMAAGNLGQAGAVGSGALDFSVFDAALQGAIDQHNASPEGQGKQVLGASAVIVTRDGGVVHTQGYGQFAADRAYLIASASKILSVGVLMRLADQGLLDMHQPISTYLGATWGEHKTTVTAAQLVSNSSGLPSLAELLGAGMNLNQETLLQYGAHFCQYMPAGFLSDCGAGIYADDQPMNNRPPDLEFRYGGSQWQLAGALAEVVSGKSWADLIRETYVEPCDAPTLGFTNPFGASGESGSSGIGYPSFFQGDSNNAPMTANPSIEGGAYITGPDYGKLLLMHLREGVCGDTRVLSAEAVREMQTDRVAAYGGAVTTGQGPSPFSGYGLGWWIGDGYVADPGAYGAYPFIDPARGYAAMILIEVESAVGGKLAAAVRPTLEAIIDGASM